MISVEEKLIDAITAAFHYLRTGRIPSPIPIPNDLPDNEVRQLITYVNRFLTEFTPFVEAMDQLAQGELETPPLPGRMAAVQSFKTLQSNLKHLTWKTQQIAAGDLEQKVDFMGDFSEAFNSMTRQLRDSYEQLERRNAFIRKTFGRYTGDDIVEVLLDLPNGLELGGEKREITLLMSDLRGFTALAEQLEPSEIVALLNHYLTVMVERIKKCGGTIDEFIGDAILVFFGAPVATEDAARRAVRCALEMQKAMADVNEHNHRMGWPEIEMGIALHTGEVVVGNIGSTKRSKYGVMGRAVNLVARIESFTVGGQVLVSPDLMRAANSGLILGDTIDIHGKGMRKAIKCRELLGHEDHPDLKLKADETSFRTFAQPLPVNYVQLTDKQLDEKMRSAVLLAMSHRRAVIKTGDSLSPYANIMLRLEGEAGTEDGAELYGKVISEFNASSKCYIIHFTLIPHAIWARLNRLTENVRQWSGASKYRDLVHDN
jgi:class 3 adenylate cyclase